MRGLPFPSNTVFEREPSYEYGTPVTNGDDIPIDPALGGIAIDPAIMRESSANVTQVKPLEHPQLPLPAPFPHRYSPSRQYPHEPQQYDQGPQGDPFAPQPLCLPIVETFPSPQKPLKKKRRPQREEECGFCSGNDYKNKKGEPETMLTCEDCSRSAHRSCLALGELNDIVYTYPWRCIECKICEVCHEKGDDERILFCDFCDRGWHMYCLPERLEEEPPGKWHCPICPELVPNDVFYDPSAEQTPGESKEPSSQSPGHSAKGKGTHGKTLQVEETDEIPRTPVPGKVRGRPKKIKAAQALDHTANEQQSIWTPKRMSFQFNPSVPLPKIRLRLPARGGKRRDRDDDEEHRKGIFDDILGVDERDTTKTSVEVGDKQRFERSRLAAELKLAPPLPLPPPPITPANENRDTLTPGPSSSRPLRSSILQTLPLTISTPTSASPAPSTPGPLARAGPLSHPPPPLRIRTIRFGQFDIQTWYDAPFPEEYANIPDGRMWICEFCLKYMKSRFGAVRHRMKCKARHPPGDEIYRDGSISIFEVDGRKNKIYCQNLCLLSKMFLDHKSLFYDVEPFLFYVMTEVDDIGARFVGYFSKEKRSPKDYNVSCIMTLPVRQRKGWGNLLIDFSYLLSKKEQRSGSPEKPLSGLGALGYKNYWTLAVMRYLESAPDHPTLEDISAVTSMTMEDICNTLSQQGMLFIRETTPPIIRPSPGQSIKFPKGRKNGIARRHLQRVQTQDEENAKAPFVTPKSYEITWDREKVSQYMAAWEGKGYPKLAPEKLKWSPFLLVRMNQSEKSEMGDRTATEQRSTGSSAHLGSSIGVSTPQDTPNRFMVDDESEFTPSDALPEYVANEGDDDSLAGPSSSPNKASQIEQDHILACAWADSPSVPMRRLRSQSTRSSSAPTTSRAHPSHEEPSPLARRGRSGSARLLEKDKRVDDPVAEDQALAAKLEWEERRSSRLLRPRLDTGSVEVASSTSNSRPSSSRKRRRVESSPDVDIPSQPVNGRRGETPPSTNHRLANGSELGRADHMAVDLTDAIDESVSLSGHRVAETMQVPADEENKSHDAHRDTPGLKFEDVDQPDTSQQTFPNDEHTLVDTKRIPASDDPEKRTDWMDRVNAVEDDDADADGEIDEDAEGEPDIELLDAH